MMTTKETIKGLFKIMYLENKDFVIDAIKEASYRIDKGPRYWFQQDYMKGLVKLLLEYVVEIDYDTMDVIEKVITDYVRYYWILCNDELMQKAAMNVEKSRREYAEVEKELGISGIF